MLTPFFVPTAVGDSCRGRRALAPEIAPHAGGRFWPNFITGAKRESGLWTVSLARGVDACERAERRFDRSARASRAPGCNRKSACGVDRRAAAQCVADAGERAGVLRRV